MAEENDAFYVVKKGDIVGVYKNLSDCQDFLGSSMVYVENRRKSCYIITSCSNAPNSSFSVFKGYGLSKETEEYLSYKGLRNAAYSLKAADAKGLFGDLVPCPFKEVAQSPPTASHLPNHFRSTNYDQYNRGMIVSGCPSCTLEFDGASKGNPGLAGAGAVLRSRDGSAIINLREGVGIATNNVAEYRAVILGLRHALKKGFRDIDVQGDSLLVCNQIKGLWKIKSQNLADLYMEAQELKNKFTSFQINHIPREQNSAADAQANRGINLRDGEIEEDYIVSPN